MMIVEILRQLDYYMTQFILLSKAEQEEFLILLESTGANNAVMELFLDCYLASALASADREGVRS